MVLNGSASIFHVNLDVFKYVVLQRKRHMGSSVAEVAFANKTAKRQKQFSELSLHSTRLPE